MDNLIINLSNKKKIGFIVMSIIIFFLSVMMVSYIDAKSIAIKSLQIVTIHDEESFKQVKNEIYNIVCFWYNENRALRNLKSPA